MLELKNKKGNVIPSVGLGTYPFQGKEMADMVMQAYKIGYRLFDTADDYCGEAGIGMAIKELVEKGICSREDLFLQTKISDNNAHADEPLVGVYFNPNHPFMHRHTAGDVVREKVENSLREMNTNYIDSLLIHYPYPQYFVDIWKEMIKLKEEGLVRYIGVSNFHVRHLINLIDSTGVMPDINECYVSPIGIKKEMVNFCNEHGCLVMTYSPLMDLASSRISDASFAPMMAKHKKSAAQIILRWNIERGCLPLPKSKNPKRLEENFGVLDFSLTKEDVESISAMNIDYQYLVESKICPGL